VGVGEEMVEGLAGSVFRGADVDVIGGLFLMCKVGRF
jgi:hypothetical protein